MTALPARIRDYEIWGRLSEGGMSEVWLAKHAVLAIPVIIKTIKTSADVTKTGGIHFADRVLDEARLMARIMSPRVVRAIDAGVHEGTPYLVQEYIDGIDLAELDRSRRSSIGVGLPLWFVCLVMSQACEGLQAAHQAGVIHRDVKPSNLFGSPGMGIRLGDFGIAVRQSEVIKESGGTLRFMAPEQLTHGPVGRTTDVWGVAATACDLRYGQPPFDQVSAVLDERTAPTMPVPRTSAEAYFQHLLRTMLSKDPRERPSDTADAGRSFDTLARALDNARRLPFVFIDRHTFRIGDCTVFLKTGDLCESRVDAIVNSANYEMKMRAGVGEALRLRGGDCIEDEAGKGGQQPLGSCTATGPGTLRCKHVIHAVSAWNEASCIGRATQRTLLMTDELGHRSLAMPALGTGMGRVTMETSANAMMTTLKWHLMLGGTRLRHVDIVLGDESKLAIYRDVAEEALRDAGASRAGADLGLPVEAGAVKVEGGTFVDPGSADQ